MPTDAQWRAKQFIPNPHNQVMFEHLRYRSARVQTRSPAGELAARVLRLNDKRSVEYRELVQGVIAALEEQKRRPQETIRGSTGAYRRLLSKLNSLWKIKFLLKGIWQNSTIT